MHGNGGQQARAALTRRRARQASGLQILTVPRTSGRTPQFLFSASHSQPRTRSASIISGMPQSCSHSVLSNHGDNRDNTIQTPSLSKKSPPTSSLTFFCAQEHPLASTLTRPTQINSRSNITAFKLCVSLHQVNTNSPGSYNNNVVAEKTAQLLWNTTWNTFLRRYLL